MEIDLQQSEAPRRRRRPALSCLACRRKKVSCDRAQPCRRCKTAGSPCTYRIHTNTSRTAQVLEETHTSSHTGGVHSSGGGTRVGALLLNDRLPHEIPTAVDQINSTSVRSVQALEQNLQHLNARVQELEQSLRASRDGNAVSHAAGGTSYGLQPTLNKTKFSKLSHWAATPAEFSNIVDFFKATAIFKQLVEASDGPSFADPAVRAIVEDSVKLMGKCKIFARSLKVSRPSRLPPPLWLHVAPPSRAMADMLVKAYFRHFESAYRILHVPTFWADYERYWSNTEAAPIALRLEICLVTAIGSSVMDYRDMTTAHDTVYAAQIWLAGPLEKHRLNIKAIQNHCLTMLARQLFGIGGDLVWTSMGQLIHEAMQMGLHRDPTHLPKTSPFQAEIRRRLWATILEMSVQSSFDSEMPARLSLEEFDTAPPANIDDEELHEECIETHSHPRNKFTIMSAQLLLLDSLPTRLRVIQLLNSNTALDLAHASCLELSTSLSKACGSLSILDQGQTLDNRATYFHRNFADYLIRRFLLYLHGPFSCNVASDPLCSYSRKVCVDTALTILSPEHDEAFGRLMIISGGIFKSGIRYVGVAIAVGLIAQARAQQSDRSLHRNLEYRSVLKGALKRLISLSEQRIKHGESNVKNHTFLSTIVAEVESIEQDLPPERAIAQSARDSLAFCYDLLLAQQGSSPNSGVQDTDNTSFEANVADYVFDFDLDDFLQGSLFS